MVLESQTVGWISREKPYLQFTTDDSDVIENHVGDVANPFESFFVQTEDGKYSEVWGMYGIVPENVRPVYRIK